MSVPEEERPNINEIRRLAEVSLPAHYVIRDGRFSYGSEPWPGAMPDDFGIVIEYENHIEEDLRGSLADIEAHHNVHRNLI